MKKLGKLVQKILTIIVILLILGTIGIFVYPSIADKTELDDKAVSFLAKQADKLVEETTEVSNEGEEVGTEVTVDGGIEDGDIITEEITLSSANAGVDKSNPQAKTTAVFRQLLNLLLAELIFIPKILSHKTNSSLP